MSVVHYAGALRIRQGRKLLTIAAGWAACCYGRRAENVRAHGNHSWLVAEVSCKPCLSRIAQHDATAAAEKAEAKRVIDFARNLEREIATVKRIEAEIAAGDQHGE